MILVPDPVCVPDQLTDYLAYKFSRRENGYHTGWANCTFSVGKMFLDQGFAVEFRFRKPVILKVCHHNCCVRYIPRTPEENDKIEDVYYPFIDDEMMGDKAWQSVLIFQDKWEGGHIWSMLGWTTREEVVKNWKPYKLVEKYHGRFSHMGFRGDVNGLRDYKSFYEDIIFPEAFPFVWSKKEATAEELAEEVRKAEEIDKTSAPSDIDWGI